jgi:hypothetical protein
MVGQRYLSRRRRAIYGDPQTGDVGEHFGVMLDPHRPILPPYKTRVNARRLLRDVRSALLPPDNPGYQLATATATAPVDEDRPGSRACMMASSPSARLWSVLPRVEAIICGAVSSETISSGERAGLSRHER